MLVIPTSPLVSEVWGATVETTTVPPQVNDPRVDEIIWELMELRRLIEENPTPAPTQPPTPDSPNPRLTNPQSITVSPGQTLEVAITVRNIGAGAAHNLLTQATASPDAPFIVEFVGNTNSINQLSANSNRNMTLRITVNENAQPGNHRINLTHLFRTHTNDNRSSEDTINVHITGQEVGTPNVHMSNFRVGGLIGQATPVGPGQNFTLSANMGNIGAAEARDVRISLTNQSADAIFFTGDLNQVASTTMAAGYTSTLNFPFQTSQNITSGTHEITFRVTYRGAPGTDPVSEEFSAFVTVYAPEADNQVSLEIRGMTTTTGNLRVGQTGTVSFYVYNTGDNALRNVRVAANTSTHIRPTQTASTQTIQNLAPGASQRLTFSFFATDAAETGSHDIGFTIGSGDNTIEQFTFLSIYNPEREEETTAPSRVQIPRVIVANTVLYPPVPRAGQEFTMEVTFRNTSATRSVNNIRILMEEVLGNNLPGQTSHFAGFNAIDGSSTLFVDFLEPLGEITRTLRFTTVTEATPGAHNMRFSFDYQDQDFYTHDAQQQVSISIAQVTRIELSDVQIGGWMTPMVGSIVPFSYNIINSGRVNLINVRTRAEGPFDVSQAGRHIGMVNAQRTTSFDGNLIPLEAGELTGQFIVYGEDITGQIVELVHEFTVFVEGGFEDEGWREGGGMDGDFSLQRPGDMPSGREEMGGFDAWCHVSEQMVTTGYMNMDTGEWVSLGNWCMDTGAWLPYSTGFDLLAFVQRPIVWGSVIALGGVAIIVVVVIVVRKRPQFDEALED